MMPKSTASPKETVTRPNNPRRRKLELKEESKQSKSRPQRGKKVTPDHKGVTNNGNNTDRFTDASRNSKMEEKMTRELKEFVNPQAPADTRKELSVHVCVGHRLILAGPPRGHKSVTMAVTLNTDVMACLNHYTKIFKKVKCVFSKATFLVSKDIPNLTYEGILAYYKEGESPVIDDPFSNVDRYSAWCQFDQESAVCFATWNSRNASLVDVAKAASEELIQIPALQISLKSDHGLLEVDLGELAIVTALEFVGLKTCTVTRPVTLHWRSVDQDGSIRPWKYGTKTLTSSASPGNLDPDPNDQTVVNVVDMDDAAQIPYFDCYPTVTRPYVLSNKAGFLPAVIANEVVLDESLDIGN